MFQAGLSIRGQKGSTKSKSKCLIDKGKYANDFLTATVNSEILSCCIIMFVGNICLNTNSRNLKLS